MKRFWSGTLTLQTNASGTENLNWYLIDPITPTSDVRVFTQNTTVLERKIYVYMLSLSSFFHKGRVILGKLDVCKTSRKPASCAELFIYSITTQINWYFLRLNGDNENKQARARGKSSYLSKFL